MPRRPLVLFVTPTKLEMEPLLVRLRPGAEPFRPATLVTGVGKASAAASLALELVARRPDHVILLGCAGAYTGGDLAPGDVVLGTSEWLADEGVEAPGGFLDLRRLGLAALRRGRSTIYNEVPLAPLPAAVRRKLCRAPGGRFEVRCGKLATVSTCSGTAKLASQLARRTRALAENMEGAAAGIAALLLSRELHEVRGISNLAGSRNRASWKIKEACAHAAEITCVLARLLSGDSS